jgi:integrase
VAEGARLESVYTGNRIVGSNPTPSANGLIRHPSSLFADIPSKPDLPRITAGFFVFTLSLSFAIIRELIVDQFAAPESNMARNIHRLSAIKVDKVKQAGMYGDGGGLYLRVTPAGTKNWVFRFMLNGRPRWMGLGPLSLYSLSEARARALEARRLRHDGIDPLEARKVARAEARLAAAKAVTFRQCAESYIKSHRAGWRNGKHAAQWEATLATYAERVIGALPVHSIDTALVLRVVEPIWTVKPETASRVRGRIEQILDWAKARGFRQGENPARWRGHLDKLLPARAKLRRITHHAALPYTELPAFLAQLRKEEGIAARALEFTILTGARTGETMGARWSEIDLVEKTWTVPAERMKAGRAHRVPLSGRALAIVEAMQKVRHADDPEAFVFPGGKFGRSLSNMSFLMLLRRMGRSDLTAHGFRATFKTWASERTSVQNEIVESALAHSIGSKVEQAYRRGDLFQKRRGLMDAWDIYCESPQSE